MASYLPPTEDLPIFDNQVFSQNDIPLTYGEAKKYFVTFPSSQGTTTITDLIAGEIDYSAPASGSFFNIGTNQVSGGHVRVGPTGISGVSVHAGNIDFTNNSINNATDALLNNISLANSQTSGVLNIATGALRTGNLNINNTTGATNNINIGAIGTTTTQNGLILAGSNSYFSGSSTTITEYIGGGLSLYNSSTTIAVNLNDFTLNKQLDMTFSGNDTQSIAFPTAPKEGQVINIRTGKHGGVITMTTTQRLFASNTNLLTANGIAGGTTITLQNIETYVFTYIGSRWIQMNDSLNPLVDSELTIGSTLTANNIIIGSALGVGDISIAAAQASGGTVTIGSANTVTSFAGGLTLGSSKYITTSHSGTITLPTSTQVGGIVSGASISTTIPTTGTYSSMASITLTQGVWIINASRRVESTTGTTAMQISLGSVLRTSASGTTSDYVYGVSTYAPQTSGTNFITVNGIASLTAASNTIYLNLLLTYTTNPTIPATNQIFTAVRIA